jgi:ATP synthase protein I
MNSHKPDSKQQPFSELIGKKVARKLKAQRNPSPGVWFGLGMMGLIGWSIVVPTLLGASIGLWLDQQYPGGHTYTLALLIAGLTLGCFNAWHWVSKEQREMHEKIGDENDK